MPTRSAPATVTPNWFAMVMGTSILATAAAALPFTHPILSSLARSAWALAGAMLAALAVATIVHYTSDRGAVRRYLDDPAMAHFYGAPAMGLLAWGAATLSVAPALVGLRAAVTTAATLWVLGTALGLATAVVVPMLAFTRHRVGPADASGAWLMPVVPPMVSATTGAMLLPHVHGELARTLAVACMAMFGLSALAALIVIAALWNRLAHHGVGPARAVPTLWIVLGPLGQSVTAVGLLADHAGPALGMDTSTLVLLSVLYGVPVMGFALMWAAIALALTLRTAAKGLPFTLAWWAFTFPVGTCVTGASVLARHTGSLAAAWLAVALYAALVLGWAVAATGTAWAHRPRPARPHIERERARATVEPAVTALR